MIVEDHASSALFLRRTLERQGHEVTVAADGSEALDLASRERFPLIISDWVMPGLDGLELFRSIRKQEREPNRQESEPYTYLILLTSKQTHDDRLEGLRAGADDFLVKPPDAEELVVRMEIARRILGVQEELERRNLLLAELAQSDELTGVGNRRWFRKSLEACHSLSRRNGLPLSLLMLDVDHFKSFNDTFGHPAGDDVLRAVSGSLRDGIRKHDELARYGGEEFAILLPNTNVKVARDLADRLRAGLASRPWPLRPITASLGVATTGDTIASPTELVSEADRALYHSKRTGRDRVTHFLDILELPTTPDPPGS